MIEPAVYIQTPGVLLLLVGGSLFFPDAFLVSNTIDRGLNSGLYSSVSRLGQFQNFFFFSSLLDIAKRIVLSYCRGFNTICYRLNRPEINLLLCLLHPFCFSILSPVTFHPMILLSERGYSFITLSVFFTTTSEWHLGCHHLNDSNSNNLTTAAGGNGGDFCRCVGLGLCRRPNSHHASSSLAFELAAVGYSHLCMNRERPV